MLYALERGQVMKLSSRLRYVSNWLFVVLFTLPAIVAVALLLLGVHP